MLLGYAFCGSFCTHSKALAVLEELINAGHTVIPIFSEIVQNISTRFGDKDELERRVMELTGNEIIKTIAQAEDHITRKKIDCMLVSPCTGNTLAKIANGITDSTVTMAVKAHLRNRKPVLLALATNDALGTNFKNIGLCSDKKHVYFVPMGQDDAENKQTSLVSDFKLVSRAMEAAVSGQQLQPLFL